MVNSPSIPAILILVLPPFLRLLRTDQIDVSPKGDSSHLGLSTLGCGAEGELKSKQEIARSTLADAMSPDLISKSMGLAIEEIETLR